MREDLPRLRRQAHKAVLSLLQSEDLASKVRQGKVSRRLHG